MRYKSDLNDFVPTTFGNLIDRFFNESVGRSGGSSYTFVPKVDIIEGEKSFELHVEAPGMNKEDFKIDLKENVLKVSGERKLRKETGDKHFRSVETRYGAFARSFVLPENVDGDKIEAKYTNGILEIVVPKDEKKQTRTTIKVA